MLDRRSFLAAAVGGAALKAAAQSPASTPISPKASTRDWSNQLPVQYPDPDMVALDNRFRRYMVGNTVIKRLLYRHSVG